MFIIKPENPVDWKEALFMLSGYRELAVSVWSDEKDENSTYLKVNTLADVPDYPEDGMVSEHQLSMAEMYFQMNWHQGQGACPLCVENTCGHLLFNKPIIPAF